MNNAKKRLTLYMPIALHQEIKQYCFYNESSLSSLVNEAYEYCYLMQERNKQFFKKNIIKKRDYTNYGLYMSTSISIDVNILDSIIKEFGSIHRKAILVMIKLFLIYKKTDK